jgi:hypothetical protein
MSLINEYRTIESTIKELGQRLEQLGSSEELKKELAFEKELRSLMATYDKGLKHIIGIFEPAPAGNKEKGSHNVRKQRQAKTYTNPNTGEQVITKGGNQKTLKQWKQTYGSEMVESWLS